MFNKKIILGLFIVVLIYLLYTFIYKSNNNESNKEEIIVENFISSNKFDGYKKGYVFKNDEKGLGYYLDKIE